MNHKRILGRGVYAITPGESMDFAQVLRWTAEILQAGISALQYRDKHCAAREQRDRATALLALCRATGTPFLVNDDPALAADVTADGVHLGADDPSFEFARQLLGPDAIIGVSCYDALERACQFSRSGADYVALGAFFPTTTKAPRAFATLDTLRAVKTQITQPVVAIGGITPDNAGFLVAAGADLLAVISSIYGAADPARQVARFKSLFEPTLECQS